MARWHRLRQASSVGCRQRSADTDHEEPLCAFCLVQTKHSASIKTPQNRPVWQGETSRPSQEVLCFLSIRRFIHICRVFQILGWCFMSSSFSAPVWNALWQTHLSKHISAELGWPPHAPLPLAHRGKGGCHAREFALGQGALSLLHHLSPCQGCVGQGLQTCEG